MKKSVWVGISIGVLILCGVWYAISSRAQEALLSANSHDGKISIVTSFYPLYFFANAIGGEFVTVKNLTPPGAEPHDYEPTTGDLSAIQKSRLLIINGAGLEPWADKLVGDLEKAGVKTVTVTEGLEAQQSGDTNEIVQDPHQWLDPVLAKIEAETIAAGLVQTDPEHQEYYRDNARKLSEKLDQLDHEFTEKLAICNKNSIVTSHAAFGYLAKRYGLTQIPISGLTPDDEPSARKLAEVTRLVRRYGVQYIFFETLVSPRLAETIARETGANTIVFNPIEGLTPRESEAGEDYFTIARKNLDNLSLALECSVPEL